MQIKVGNDIISTVRIENLYKAYGSRFTNKVYTEAEIKYCESKKTNKYQSYAARFAAKEAIFKAISCFVEDKYKIGWKDIEVLNDISGRPYAKVIGVNCIIDISMSHEKEYAIATAIAIEE